MHNNERIYVDVHVLQTVPPSCVNRDDTGSPKTAVYGGVTRARVSSQAWKHAMRLKFREMLSAGDVGQRTKLVVDLIAGKILELQPDLSEKKAQQLAQKVLEAAGVKVKEDKEKLKTGALFFVSPGQIQALAEIALQPEDGKLDKAACQAALKTLPTVDLALFGRMVADDPCLNFDARHRSRTRSRRMPWRTSMIISLLSTTVRRRTMPVRGIWARWNSIRPRCIAMRP